MMKKLLSFIMIAVILFSAFYVTGTAYSSTRYNYAISDTDIINTPDGLYLLRYCGTSLEVQQVAPVSDEARLSLREGIYTAYVFRRTVVALCNDAVNDRLIVYLYDMDTEILDRFMIAQAAVAQKSFYYDGDLYLISHKDNRVLERYNKAGTMIENYTFPTSVSYVFGSNCSVLAICANNLYRIDSSGYTAISGTVHSPARFLNSSTLTDGSNCVYSLSSAGLSYMMRVSDMNAVCMIDDTVYYANGSVIYGFSKGKRVSYLNTGSPITALYANNNRIVAIENSGSLAASYISIGEFTKIKEVTAPSEYQNQHSQNTGFGINSAVYRVDNERFYIIGIESGTTVAGFKSKMNFDGYSVSCYRNGKEVKSGQVGTAMTAVFDSGTRSVTYELGVTGDLTGEGNANSRDISLLMDYLLGTVQFSGIYLIAADLSDEGIVDVLDLALLNQ